MTEPAESDPTSTASMDVTKVTSVSELIDLLRNTEFADPVFRGVSSADYSLTPTSVRRGAQLHRWSGEAVATIDAKTQVELEFVVLGRFFKASDRSGLELPDDGGVFRSEHERGGLSPNRSRVWDQLYDRWLPTELLEIAALAQHYGLPTRMLDWTFNPLTAAYFALPPPSSGSRPFAIWILETSESANVEVVTPPYARNANLAAQQGVLTTVPVAFPMKTGEAADATPHEELICGHGNNSRPPLHKIEIELELADELKNALHRFGVNTASLFPGFDGVRRLLQPKPTEGPNHQLS